MKHKTQFRLALKAIGVYFFALGLVSLTHLLSSLLYWLEMPSNWNPGGYSINNLLQMSLYPLASLGMGLYLFFRGEWVVNLAIPSNRPYCPQCAYDLTGASTARCPECGTPFRWEDVLPAKSSNTRNVSLSPALDDDDRSR